MEVTINVPDIPNSHQFDRGPYRVVAIARQVLTEQGRDPDSLEALSEFTGFSQNVCEHALTRLAEWGA